MNENDGRGVTVPSFTESSCVEGRVEETLIGNFSGGVEEGDYVGGNPNEGGKDAEVPSVAIDTKISVSVSPGDIADVDEPLTIENKEVGCSIANIDNVEDQELEGDVGGGTKVDVVKGTVSISSVDQTQYAAISVVTATESKVLNSMVEVTTTSDISNFIASSKEFKKETSGNADDHGDESTLEEACVDGGYEASMDIDEVMDYKDDVLGNNAFGGTVSDLEEDEHMKLKVEKVAENLVMEVAQAELKSSDKLILTADGGDVALIELENANFEVQEETNGNDVDCERIMLYSSKGDINEGYFSVSDLVWGKVSSHPWWPGQIFDPDDASEKALKYHKKDSFLVAYFGDQTFAWNDAAVLKPFVLHFSQVQKHNNSEAFRHAISCALEEVSRRVELGLACTCIPEDAYDKIKFQVVENTGIKQESSIRYGAEKSAAVSSFEPGKLLDYLRALAKSPYDETDQLELVLAKAQLSSFSRYKGYPQLPEFYNSGELLESDDTSELIETIEYPNKKEEEVLVENSFSQKRKHGMMNSVYPNKKEKNLSDLMVDTKFSTDGEEDGIDGKGTSKSASAAGKRRRAIQSFPDGSDKSKSSHATSPIPKPSFKIGECIRRAASQLTGSPSILKGSSEKFLKVDEDDDPLTGFEVSEQTSGTSPRGRMNTENDPSSVNEMLWQLHLAAQDPMKGYSFLSTIIPFFSSYRTSVVSKSRRQNSSTGRPGITARKRKASNDAGEEFEFEFDDVNDSYWTDRIIQNYSEEQLSQDGQNADQPVVLEWKKKVKSGRKANSRKQFSNNMHKIQADELAEPHVDLRKQDLPTELVLNFAVGVSVPPEMNLNKTFRRFGPLMDSETEVDRQGSRARVVFKKCSDAEVAYSSARKFNIFGSKVVNYELNYLPVVSYKPLPLPILEGPDGAT